MDTVIVTGGAGFIGSHVVDALLADGRSVVVVDDLSTGKATNVAEEATLEVIDITDSASLGSVVDAAEPSAIFHLGAQSMVTVSVSDPMRDCRVNVIGTLNVLEAAKRHGAPVVFTSTGGALYGNDAPRPTPETHPPAPLSPYGASKWAAEAYVRTWANATGVGHSVCRLANVYGPRQSPYGEAGVVSILSNLLWRGKTPTLYGFGRATRDYVHVSDVAEAMLRACGANGVFNVSTGREVEVIDIFNLLARESGATVQPRLAALREGELERSCMDPAHARDELEWAATVELEAGVPATYRALVSEFTPA
ncbi:MAG: GDP-mannose 4,6-dehydratase [Solirubrobacterales bacterium]|nr:GDP-mannose 4,6-dehydratase [Solirubrobacterales bacterium]